MRRAGNWLGLGGPLALGAGANNAATASQRPFQASWDAYLATNPRLRDPRVLPALVRKGVPQELRREVWSHCLGIDPGEPGAGKVEELASSELPEGAEALIEADLLRTFPNSAEFQAAGGTESLRRMLRRVALLDPEIGYCQSLNFLVAILFMVLLSEAAAVLAVRQLLVKLGIRNWYMDGMRQLRADTLVLEDLLKERLPQVQQAFRIHKFELLFVVSKWFLALFATTLEGETLRRVWDAILCDGIEVVFRVAYAMLHRQSEGILQCRSIDELVRLFQGRQPGLSAEELLAAAYHPSMKLGRAELAQRRKQAAARMSSAEMNAEIRNVIILRGGVRPASALARTSRDVG